MRAGKDSEVSILALLGFRAKTTERAEDGGVIGDADASGSQGANRGHLSRMILDDRCGGVNRRIVTKTPRIRDKGVSGDQFQPMSISLALVRFNGEDPELASKEKRH
jgi:hypothetical protein